jgi:hypothetical protein
MMEDNQLAEEPDAHSVAPEEERNAAEESEVTSALETVEALPSMDDDAYLLVLPGGEFEIAQELPRPRKLPKAVVYHSGDLILCDGKRRTAVRTPRSSNDADEAETPLATRLVLVFIKYRAVPPRSRSRRYLIATDSDDELFGWIDHSPPGWDFSASTVRSLAHLTAIEYLSESFDIETAFELAHPRWVT